VSPCSPDHRDSYSDVTSNAPRSTPDTPWPPVPGDFVLGSNESSVAVCTLASQGLLSQLKGCPEVAIAGRVYTENVGIEKMVANLLANQKLRFLVLCGHESRHRVGQAIMSLHRNGIDPISHRIQGATAPEPFLPNLSTDEVAAFQRRFEVIDLIGERDANRILERVRGSVGGVPAAAGNAAEAVAASAHGPQVIQAETDPRGAWTYDRLGFFLIHVDRGRQLVVLEHYGQDRRLLHRLEGKTAAALSQTAVRLGLVGELDHAAYLGRELAKAEAALRFELHYQQDSPLK
jgi:tetrahydromethanopterin S-methyltransferase subunit A